MRKNKIPARYGAALFKLAKEKNKIDAIYNDLNAILSFCGSIVCLEDFLSLSFIEKKKRIEIIEILGRSLSMNDESVNFICLLIEMERIGFLLKIFKEYSRLRDAYMGIINVGVVSASPLTDKEIDKIKGAIEKNFSKKAVINGTVSESIMGGYVIKIGDMVYDLSIKTSLENLLVHLKKGAFSYGG